ncbi:hypothetical protein ACRC6Q_01620 [Planococcus sp. SE5232]|uniref:hypothetical protein n=1 Tax=unclassified Planococcus (in: firmicutes) TaxID=2662419 RepID=UPI003D6B0CCB
MEKKGSSMPKLDIDKIAENQFDFDASGHYSRTDVFQLSGNEKEQKHLVWEK